MIITKVEKMEFKIQAMWENKWESEYEANLSAPDVLRGFWHK